MGMTITGSGIDEQEIIDALALDEFDMISFGEIIIQEIVTNILNQKTADGRPLSLNSRSWQAKKLRESRLPWPLQYTGKLAQESTFRIEREGENLIVVLEPDYRDIHLNLIEISEKTGKNYQDFFGITETAGKKIEKEFSQIIEAKLLRFLHG